MFSTCPSVRSFVRPSVRCQSCERDICLKTNDPISLQIGTSGLLGQGDEAVNIGGQEVKVQGHTTPKYRFGDLAEASFSTPSVE